MHVAFQEQTFGRMKATGAPLWKSGKYEAVNLESNDSEGNQNLPGNSHVRLAHHASNEGMRILRRSYSYGNGVTFTAEWGPLWHQGMDCDAGPLFIG